MFQTRFDTRQEASEYVRDVLCPTISQYIRLFKTPKQRQLEYIVLHPDWLQNDSYQTYGLDRDVVDKLASVGVPPIVVYQSFDGKKPVQRKVSTLKTWRRSVEAQREQLNGLCYLPGQPMIVGSRFNTYRDVSVEPIDGVDLSELLDHIHDNLCNGNTRYYDYLLRWLAHMVQRPTERPMTGIAIIGGQGTGKGIFIEFLKRMLGGNRNCNTTASADDTKGFNYALGSKLLVVFDEATFSGDRKQSDFMKKLVTEAHIRIEQKGLDAYEVENFARVFITSNNMQSAVPATIGARRWLIIECRDNLSRSELVSLANRIGNSTGHPDEVPNYVNAFMHRLLHMDLSDFDPGQLPQQDTGFETKLHNHYKEDPMYAFLCEFISAPELTMYRMMSERTESGVEEYDEKLQWDEQVLFATFYAVFKDACIACFGRPPGSNMLRQLLDPYGITVRPGTGNVRYVHLPHPSQVLKALERSARFDLLVSAEQRELIGEYKMYKDGVARQQALKAAEEVANKSDYYIEISEMPGGRGDFVPVPFRHNDGRVVLYSCSGAAAEAAYSLNAMSVAKEEKVGAKTLCHMPKELREEDRKRFFPELITQEAEVRRISSALPSSLPDPIPPEPADTDAPWFMDMDGNAEWLEGVDEFVAMLDNEPDDPFGFAS